MPVEKILFIDDNPATNLINRRLIEKNQLAKTIIMYTNVVNALAFIQSKNETGDYPKPDFIFIDLNLPGMNGWDFLDAFGKLAPEITQNTACIILTTSDNKLDEDRAKTYSYLKGYLKKPLSKEKFCGLLY